MGPPSYMRPVVGRNVFMRRIPVMKNNKGTLPKKRFTFLQHLHWTKSWLNEQEILITDSTRYKYRGELFISKFQCGRLI
jgi:hypothetical protein